MMRILWKSYCAEWRDAFTLTDPVQLFLARGILIGTHAVVIMLVLVIVLFARLIGMFL